MFSGTLLCPYCGGVLNTTTGVGVYTCQSCGKNNYASRSDLTSMMSDRPLGDAIVTVLDLATDNAPRALEKVEELIEENGETPDLMFTRGCVYAHMGEDGKAHNDWKTGLSLLDTFNDIDAYVCLICDAIADLIIYKEVEFIEFDYQRYIDRISREIYECIGDSCRAIVYSTLYRIYMTKLKDMHMDVEDDLFTDIVPRIFRRIIEYTRDYRETIVTIERFLNQVGFDEETYEDDDDYECYLYHLVKLYLVAYTAEMTDADAEAIMLQWNDENMSVLEDHFEEIVSCVRDPTMLQGILSIKNDECIADLPEAVNGYVTEYLLLKHEDSDEPETV